MKKMELGGGVSGVKVVGGWWVVGETYMPAMAKGLVSSRTRWPASRPSPSTEMTTKSSLDMVIWSASVVGFFGFGGTRGAKYSCANALEHTTEHSMGVMEMFRKEC